MSFIKESQFTTLSPPPPPIPPSISSILTKSELKPETNILTNISKEEELSLALQSLLYFNKDFNSIFYSTYLYLKPQLQVGPKCGLVALSIATSVLQNFVDADTIFKEALTQGFSKQGEMFDVNYLADLAKNLCSFKPRVIKGGLFTHVKCIIQNLLNKNLILVPYDADHNHAPCCKSGHKAHWAVISGFVIIKENENKCNDNDDDDDTVELETNCNLCECISQNTNNRSMKLMITDTPGKVIISKKFRNVNTIKNFRKGKIYLIGRQGKSRHLGVWSFDDMSASNDNLNFFSINRESNCYILPKGGLAEGLKGKAIILDIDKGVQTVQLISHH